jgi:flagellin
MRINTNVAALTAQNNMTLNNRLMNNSLEKLSSGLRINKAADDASGMTIADSLRSQANSLGQGIKNANEGIGIMQIADKAMDEQVKILDTIKTKALQASQDGQSSDSRASLQKDISKLMKAYDDITKNTSYNGISLLGGSFTNKQFQVGAYANQTIGTSISSTSMDKVGLTRMETTNVITGLATNGTALSTLTFNGRGPGGTNFVLNSVAMGTSAGQGIGKLADTINSYSDQLGVKASWTNQVNGTAPVAAGNITGLIINGQTIGDINGVLAGDSDGKLVSAINSVSDKTGVRASVTSTGALQLNSLDGRGIDVKNFAAIGNIADGHTTGRLSLTSTDGRDINVTDGGTAGVDTSTNQSTLNLASVIGSFTDTQSAAAGAYANAQDSRVGTGVGTGVTSREGAMMTMNIADSAIKALDSIRSDLGSTQNQFTSTINNISVTQVNVKSAESQIRDVDFAEESANFSKMNIIAQAGSYALTQANQTQQSVLRLLQ